MTAAATFEHPIGPHTVDDWRAAEHPTDGSRLELIWGYYHVSPAPGGPHQHASGALYFALRQALKGNDRFHAVPAVAVEISTAIRTGLIPDVAVLNTPPVAISFPASALVLAVEVWSPGNSTHERETKVAGYANAGVPYLWTVELHSVGRAPSVRTFELVGGIYRDRTPVMPREGDMNVVLPGPVDVPVDLADLAP